MPNLGLNLGSFNSRFYVYLDTFVNWVYLNCLYVGKSRVVIFFSDFLTLKNKD